MGSGSRQNAENRLGEITRHLERLSKSDIPATEFFSQFLESLVNSTKARAGAIWLKNSDDSLHLAVEAGLSEIGLDRNAASQQINRKLVQEVIETGQACIRESSDLDNMNLSTNVVIFLSALLNHGRIVGAVELFQRSDIPPEARAGNLQFLEHLTVLANQYLEHQSQKSPANGNSERLSDLNHFSIQLHRSLSVDEVAVTVANDGRILLGCDRLSLAIRRGNRVTIQAISGQDSINHRANLVSRMEKLATEVLSTTEPLLYDGRKHEFPSRLEVLLADYIRESSSRSVMILPLFGSEPLVGNNIEEPDTTVNNKKNRKVIGGLIVEWTTAVSVEQQNQVCATEFAEHVSSALSNALIHQRIFLLPLWQMLGGIFSWLRGKGLVKALFLATAVLLIVLLSQVSYDYRVESNGRLMPVVQKNSFAPWDGEVVEIFVKSGQRVQAGQQLLRLRNDELTAQTLAVQNELEEKEQTRLTTEAELAVIARNVERENEIRLRGELEETLIEISGLKLQLETLEGRLDQLTVRSPITGIVVTFHIDQLLQNRPVHRGELLLEIMDDHGPWQLELEIEERRMGHIFKAQEFFETEQLDVEFALATMPEATFHGKLITISTRSNLSEVSGSIVEAVATFDSEELPNHRIGAEVTAKINCGKRSLMYVLFGDVVEFMQTYFWI